MAIQRSEGTPQSLVPLNRLPWFRGDLALDEQETELLTPVGVMFFNGGKGMILLKEQHGGDLHARHVDTPEGLRKPHIVEQGRVIDLSDCTEVFIRQFKLGGEVRVGLSDTFERNAASSVRFAYQTIPLDVDEERKQDNVEFAELDVLRAMTGEAGGVRTFKNAGLPTVGVFIVKQAIERQEQEPDKQKQEPTTIGHVFLFPASEVHGDHAIKSTEAVENFLNRLCQQFEAHSRLPIQTSALASYDASKASFTLTGRESVYRAALIATARLYTFTGLRQYADILKRQASELPRHLLGRLVFALQQRIYGISQEGREQLVDVVLGTAQMPKITDQKAKQQEDGNAIIQGLKTEQIRLLRGEFGAPNRMRHPRYFAYVQTLFNRIQRVGVTLDEVSDAELLLAEATEVVNTHGNWGVSYTISGSRLDITNTHHLYSRFLHEGATISNFLSDVQNAVAARRARLEQAVAGQLRTKRAREAREVVDSDFGEFSAPMYAYASSIYDIAYWATTIEELDDAIKMARELRTIASKKLIYGAVIASRDRRKGHFLEIRDLPGGLSGGQTFFQIGTLIISGAMIKRDKMIAGQ